MKPKIRLRVQHREKDPQGKATRAKSMLELVRQRLFDPGEETLADMIVVGTEETESPDSALGRDLTRRTLGLGAIGERYHITPENQRNWHELKMQFKDALMEDGNMEKDYTKDLYGLVREGYEFLLNRSFYKWQIETEVVAQEPYVIQVPVPSNYRRLEEEKLD